MANFTYNRDVPDAPNNPSVDQPDMKVNTNSTDDLIAVDHVSFNINDGGFHKVIHQITQGSDPAAILGVNQVYSKNYTPDTTGGVADTQLFTRTGNAGISQLTGNLTQASNLSDGWVWAGGLLFQWGNVFVALPVGTTGGTVLFKDRVVGAIPFPNFCFTVQATLLKAGASGGVATIATQQNTDKTGFNWEVRNTGASYVGFSWFAVGI